MVLCLFGCLRRKRRCKKRHEFSDNARINALIDFLLSTGDGRRKWQQPESDDFDIDAFLEVLTDISEQETEDAEYAIAAAEIEELRELRELRALRASATEAGGGGRPVIGDQFRATNLASPKLHCDNHVGVENYRQNQ